MAQKRHIGYDNAIELAKEQLAGLDPAAVCANTGAAWNGEEYLLPWYGEAQPLSATSPEQQIIGMHYLLAQGPKAPRGRAITYKQVPGAAIYNDNFIKRCVDPMVGTFAADLEGFLRQGDKLGGVRAGHGHASFTLHPLPYLPITFILWQGDDEVPAAGNILYDEGAVEWLCAEDLVVLAGLPVYTMIGLYKSE